MTGQKPWWHGSDDTVVAWSDRDGGRWAKYRLAQDTFRFEQVARSDPVEWTEGATPVGLMVGDAGTCEALERSTEDMFAKYWIQVASRAFLSWHPTTLLGLAYELRLGRPKEHHENYGVWRVIYKVLLGIPNSGKTNMIILLEKLLAPFLSRPGRVTDASHDGSYSNHEESEQASRITVLEESSYLSHFLKSSDESGGKRKRGAVDKADEDVKGMLKRLLGEARYQQTRKLVEKTVGGKKCHVNVPTYHLADHHYVFTGNNADLMRFGCWDEALARRVTTRALILGQRWFSAHSLADEEEEDVRNRAKAIEEWSDNNAIATLIRCAAVCCILEFPFNESSDRNGSCASNVGALAEANRIWNRFVKRWTELSPITCRYLSLRRSDYFTVAANLQASYAVWRVFQAGGEDANVSLNRDRYSLYEFFEGWLRCEKLLVPTTGISLQALSIFKEFFFPTTYEYLARYFRRREHLAADGGWEPIGEDAPPTVDAYGYVGLSDTFDVEPDARASDPLAVRLVRDEVLRKLSDAVEAYLRVPPDTEFWFPSGQEDQTRGPTSDFLFHTCVDLCSVHSKDSKPVMKFVQHTIPQSGFVKYRTFVLWDFVQFYSHSHDMFLSCMNSCTPGSDSHALLLNRLVLNCGKRRFDCAQPEYTTSTRSPGPSEPASWVQRQSQEYRDGVGVWAARLRMPLSELVDFIDRSRSF